ncbi:MAG: KpsF/GutQ family sugar-phosphate isomerase [Burkholderiales bacterium]|nr:KpsF/GutQ family sugar-phosphate isomerase [Betaproteobacteria bacterium]
MAQAGFDRHPTAQALELARQVLRVEAQAVAALIPRIDERFLAALDLILNCSGRVVVSGIGKSGHVARKIASTLASTGTPAFFVHPAEASHGDLGMITREDVFIGLSNSGESEELLTIIPLIKRQGAKLIAFTGNTESSLAREADVHLDAGVTEEACPLGLAPTASTTAALALGDALAVALLDARGFGAEDFARSHPGGKLGIRLLTRVRDVMRSGDALPSVPASATLADAVLEISRKGLGITCVLDSEGRLAGVYTDGDLRRSLEKNIDFRSTCIAEVMTRNPRTVKAEHLAAEAVQIMEDHRISQLVVVDDENRPVGALNMHDLFRAKVL